MRLWLARLLLPRAWTVVPSRWVDGSWERSVVAAAWPTGPQFEVVGRTIERLEVVTTEGGEVMRIHTSGQVREYVHAP